MNCNTGHIYKRVLIVFAIAFVICLGVLGYQKLRSMSRDDKPAAFKHVNLST